MITIDVHCHFDMECEVFKDICLYSLFFVRASGLSVDKPITIRL